MLSSRKAPGRRPGASYNYTTGFLDCPPYEVIDLRMTYVKWYVLIRHAKLNIPLASTIAPQTRVWLTYVRSDIKAHRHTVGLVG